MPLLETKGAASAQGFGLTSAVAAANYIEDCFSVWLYTGNGSTQTITNGIDLAGKGGLTWIKRRNGSGTEPHVLVDTLRGSGKYIASNTADAQIDNSAFWTYVFGSNGWSITASGSEVNNGAGIYASWTFRKQPKFFDVVTYTGNGSNRTISHNLGSVPGCIVVKRTDTTADWQVYHRSLANTEYLVLNLTDAKATGTDRWNSTTATSTVFSLGTNAAVNASGGTFVAYLFAHDAGGFGNSGTDNVISCGGYTGNGSATGPTVTLGYEPQWLMVKNSSGVGNWNIIDNMRGMPVGSADAFLEANTSDAEATADWVTPTATGFQIVSTSSEVNTSSSTYIYIAIRRGPMRTPTTGTSVFSPVTYTGTGGSTSISAGFVVDAALPFARTQPLPNGATIFDRLRGALIALFTSNTVAEGSNTGSLTGFDSNTSILVGSDTGGRLINYSAYTYVNYLFRRAPGFFDVVCYTGTGANRTVSHNLGAVPEMMIVKKRSAADDWAVYANNDNTDFLLLNTTAATADDNTYWNDTSPTASVFTVGTNADVNTSAATYVAYLFATVTGVSKVGSYTGNGSSQTINCGFTGGARFVLIKRTDSTGDWYVWDSARGIVAGNDPHLSLNSTAAEVTTDDSVDTDSTGFVVNQLSATNVNVSSATYIFLAIA
jgi:hypothetical protein